ncbi:MAG TPA: NfeD family protein [Acidimicrobiales bacterium]|nr:NfeD family protein [Acidimicrobiales bacterium]
MVGLSVFLLGGFARRAGAQAPPTGHIDVVQINGLIDPIQADFLRRAVAGAENGAAEALVVQLNSGGGVVSTERLRQLTATLSSSRVPVAVWVGPNGSRAFGAAFAIFQAAPLRGMAPGTRTGQALPPDPMAGRTVDDTQAAALGLASINQPTLGDFIVNLDGKTVAGRTLNTAQTVRANGEPRRQPTVAVRFEKLNLVEQLLHTAASPSVAYLMVLIGLLLIALEFFTAGIGIAAACGTGALILASYGLGVLPVRVWALVLVGIGVFGFCIDLQAGVPRVWSVVGAAALLVGSLFLYHGGVRLSLLALAAGVLGTPLFMVAGMPAMIRARFSTPTIGRQSLVGEMGVALGPVEPEGTVEVRGAPWQARTNRATPIKVGEAIRVVAIDGLLLEVEPETGGARDAHH